jgi:hypothetical protein
VSCILPFCSPSEFELRLKFRFDATAAEPGSRDGGCHMPQALPPPPVSRFRSALAGVAPGLFAPFCRGGECAVVGLAYWKTSHSHFCRPSFYPSLTARLPPPVSRAEPTRYPNEARRPTRADRSSSSDSVGLGHSILPNLGTFVTSPARLLLRCNAQKTNTRL